MFDYSCIFLEFWYLIKVCKYSHTIFPTFLKSLKKKKTVKIQVLLMFEITDKKNNNNDARKRLLLTSEEATQR